MEGTVRFGGWEEAVLAADGTLVLKRRCAIKTKSAEGARMSSRGLMHFDCPFPLRCTQRISSWRF